MVKRSMKSILQQYDIDLGTVAEPEVHKEIAKMLADGCKIENIILFMFPADVPMSTWRSGFNYSIPIYSSIFVPRYGILIRGYKTDDEGRVTDCYISRGEDR